MNNDFKNLEGLQGTGLDVAEVGEDFDDIFNDSPEDIEDKKEKKKDPEPIKKKDSDEDEPEVKPDPKKNKKDKEEQDEIFNDDPHKKTSAPIEDDNINLLYGMIDKGLIDLDEEDLENITDTEALRLIQDSYDEAIMAQVEEAIKGLPPLVKELATYSLNGGNPEDYIRGLYEKSKGRVSLEMDINKEENQELLMREVLRSEDYDSEDIESQIEHLKDTGRLEKVAKKRFEKWKIQAENIRKSEIENQKKRLEAQKMEERKFRDNLYNTVNEIEDLGGLKLSKADRRTLADYMVTRSINTQGGAISQFYADLSEVLGNPKAFIQLAKLVKSRNKDGSFSFSEIERYAETKVTNKVKDNLQRKGTAQLRNRGRNEVDSMPLSEWLSQYS